MAPAASPWPLTWRTALGNAALVVAALTLWALIARIEIGGRPLMAGPVSTLSAFASDGPTIGLDLLATFARAAAGLLLGSVLGVALGLLFAALIRVAPAAEALLDFARSVPPVVLLPSFLLALGYDDRARVATVAAGCSVIIAVCVTTAARAPLSARAELLALSGATWSQRLRWTQPWEALPTLLAGLRIAAATAVVVTTVTEMVAGAPTGIGARIVSAQVAGQTPQLTAAIVAVGASGWALNALLRALQRGAVPGEAPLENTLR